MRTEIKLPVLMYHWFAPSGQDTGSRSPQLEIEPALFETHISWLARKGYSSISLTALHDHVDGGAPLPEKPVVITFDDGTRDFATHGWPALRRHGFTATMFVVAGRVGETNLWDQALGEPVRNLLSWDELARLGEEGLEIGSHTLTHIDLASASDDQAHEELLRSREVLEGRLGIPVEHLAYPFGRFHERTAQIARRTGYRGACAVLLSRFDLFRSDRFQLRRLTVKRQDRGLRFALRLRAGRVRHRMEKLPPREAGRAGASGAPPLEARPR